MTVVRFETASAEETRALGARIAAHLRPGDVVLLHGDLGAGKTTLTQGIAAALGAARPAQSPTFALVADAPLPDGTTLRHIDLYRLESVEELDDLGFEESIGDPEAIVVVEWPERAIGLLPESYLLVELTPAGADRRRIDIRAVGLGDRFSGI